MSVHQCTDVYIGAYICRLLYKIVYLTRYEDPDSPMVDLMLVSILRPLSGVRIDLLIVRVCLVVRPERTSMRIV